jgi:hypothetical protein
MYGAVVAATATVADFVKKDLLVIIMVLINELPYVLDYLQTDSLPA